MILNANIIADEKPKMVNKTANKQLEISLSVSRLPIGTIWLDVETNAQGKKIWTLNWQEDSEDPNCEEIAYGMVQE